MAGSPSTTSDGGRERQRGPESTTRTRPAGGAIGVDVGGSGIKAAVVDIDTGELRSERLRVPTPTPSTPDKVGAVDRPARPTSGEDDDGCRPTRRSASGCRAWRSTDGSRRPPTSTRPGSTTRSPRSSRRRSSGRSRSSTTPTRRASPRCASGSGAGKPGVVIFLTLGTGVGSGVFVDGVLVPEHRVRPDGDPRPPGRAAIRVGGADRGAGLSWKAWAQDLDEHLQRIEDLMWPTPVHPRRRRQQERRQVRPAADDADAGRAGRSCATTPGIIGAAIVAVEGLADAAATWDDLPDGPTRRTDARRDRVARPSAPGVSSGPFPARPAPAREVPTA